VQGNLHFLLSSCRGAWLATTTSVDTGTRAKRRASHNAFPCGTAPRTMMHLIYDCPRFQHIRNQRDYHKINHYTSPDTFFTDPDTALIFAKFLSEGRVGFKPEDCPIVEYRDGRPSASSSRPRGPVPDWTAVPAAQSEVMVPHLNLDRSDPFDPG
jgi:hypothetical protein